MNRKQNAGEHLESKSLSHLQLTSGTRAKLLRRFQEDPTIKVLIGLDEIAFYPHKKKICAISPFFKAALTRGFKEGIEGVVRLPEENTEVFEDFMAWLYASDTRSSQGHFAEGFYLENSLDDCPDEPQEEFWIPVLSLYILADKLGVYRLMNDIADLMALAVKNDNERKLPWGQSIKLVFGNLPSGSKMQKLIGDWAVAIHQRALGDKAPGLFGKAFGSQLLLDCPMFGAHILIAQSDLKDIATAFSPFFQRCRFHEHSKDGTAGRETECKALSKEATEKANRKKKARAS